MRNIVIQESITSSRTANLNRYFNDLSKFDPLSPDEEVNLFKKIKNGDTAVIDKIVKANLRFVISVAKQYQFTAGKPDLTDLISAGNIGLITAVEKFDYTKGFKFISYAVWWIRNEIIIFLNQNKTIRASSDKNQKYNRLQKIVDDYVGNYGRHPTNEELAEISNLKIEEVKNLMLYFKQTTFPKSIDAQVGQDSDSLTLLDIIETTDEQFDSFINTESTATNINRLMSNVLTAKEIKILKMTYGFNENNQEYSPNDISEEVGVSAERIRQIRATALKKLKWNMKRIIV